MGRVVLRTVRRGGRSAASAAPALWRRRRPLLRGTGLVLVGGIVAFAGWAWLTAARMDLGAVGESAVIYAAGQPLAPGLSVEAIDLAGALRRLRYQEVSAPPRRVGQYRRSDAAWEIYLHARDDPRGRRPPRRVRLDLDEARIAAVVDAASEAALADVELEPEPLSGLRDTFGRVRRPVRLADVPKAVTDAVLAAEDHRFFEHGGVDLRAVARALWVNVRHGDVVQGGSTLTQQLVKNLVLSPRRTWGRKIREAAVAVTLEWQHSKPEILEAYLNALYLGQHGSVSIYGIGAAAEAYFGKEVTRLTLGEAALLAGMIRAPNTYSPLQNPARARERRAVVLRRMRTLGLIDPPAHERATREPIRVRRGLPARLLAPYFLDYVRLRLEQAEPFAELDGSGLRIYTGLDPVLQRAAEAALARGLDRLERHRHLRRTDPAERLQGALVALDPTTGEIRAMVGGRDYATSQFNRAIFAHRQPGSAFKPFVYLAALRGGPDGAPPALTPASFVEDAPLELTVGKDTWAPRNYEDRFEGIVTVRRALEQSLNAATVRVAQTVGLSAVIRTARDVGLTSRLQPVPALSLGSFEVTPLELATGYAALANGGERVAPQAVRAVMDPDGGVVAPTGEARTRAASPEAAYVVTYLLEGVVERGTGAAARTLGVEGPVAGKTGTTNDGRDAWFVGYTPRLVALVWVGFDEGDVLKLSGAQAALPIWADFMRTAIAALPSGPFTPPPGIAFRDVDPTTGALATAFCPVVVREAFLAGTEPTKTCPEHGPGQVLDSLLRRFLDLFK